MTMLKGTLWRNFKGMDTTRKDFNTVDRRNKVRLPDVHVTIGLITKVKAKAPFTRYNLLSNRLLNRVDNRLYRVYKHSTGCQTGLTTGWMFVYNRLYRVNGG